jgi:hypothetical protein
MLYKTIIYFIAGHVVTAVERAAIEELGRISHKVLVRAARLVDGVHEAGVDAVAGAVPPAYAGHPQVDHPDVWTGMLDEVKADLIEAGKHIAGDAAEAASESLGDAWKQLPLGDVIGGAVADGWTTALENAITK